MKPSTIIVTAFLGMVVLGQAQDTPEPPVPTVVVCEIRMIEAPRAEVNRLLPKTVYVLKQEILGQLQDWVNQRRAAILAQPTISTISGNAAQVRAVRELIYPTEFEATGRASSSEAHGSNVTVQVTGESSPGAATLLPSTFKTREVGTLLNVTPQVGADSKTINLTLIPELSQMSKLGFVKHEMAAPTGKTEVSQPDFYSWNVATSVVLKSGTTVLLAVLDPVANEQYMSHDNVVLVLLTATVCPIE